MRIAGATTWRESPHSAARRSQSKVDHGVGHVASAFRPEIQALRAIAVTLVVVYHIDSRLMPGGFVGVDVFFVISGYLMTRRLAGEAISTGRIRLRRFYSDRAQRLLPAALIVILATLLATLTVTPKNLWGEFGSQIAASALYVENWALALNSVNYSAPGADSSPLQHFWSLGVEEQFYLVWPIFIVGCWQVGKRVRSATPARVLAVAIVCVVVGSFIIGVIWTSLSAQSSYFATPTRLWELALGGLVWIVERRFAGSSVHLVGWVGILVIAACAALYSGSTPYPGFAAAVPCFATAIVILSGQTRGRGSFSKVATFRPLQYVGDISYSIYLWHWPLVVFAPIVLSNQFRAPEKLLVGVLTLALASLSKPLIEDRFRHHRLTATTPRRTLALLSGITVVSVGLAASGLVVSRTGNNLVESAIRETDIARASLTSDSGAGAPKVVAPIDVAALVPRPLAARQDVVEHDQRGDDCLATGADSRVVRCSFGADAGSRHVVLVGDSHAAQWLPALETLAQSHHWHLVTMLRTGCPFSATLTTRAQEDGAACVRWIERVRTLLGRGTYDLVVTSAYSGTGYATNDSAGAVRGFEDVWKPVQDAGSTIVAIRDTPIPEAAGVGDVPACVLTNESNPMPCSVREGEALLPDPQVVAARRLGVSVADLSSEFCAGGTCPPARGGVLIYRDGNHVTATFARTTANTLYITLARALEQQG